jgi:predicted transcriptional regulator
MVTRVVTAHLPQELAEKLDGLAGRMDRPRGWLVKEAVEAYIGLVEERRRETLAALKEVDTGRFVEHTAVEAWSSTLDGARRAKARRKRRV